jgi:hypothetical protein
VPGTQIGIDSYCLRNPTAFICTGNPNGNGSGNGTTNDGSATSPGGSASAPSSSSPTITSAALPGQPASLYVRKYPDGLAGVWSAKKAAMENTGFASLISGLVPSLGTGGCPAMALPGGTFLGLNVAGGSVAPPCWVWALVQAVMMVTALIASRRIIFGG